MTAKAIKRERMKAHYEMRVGAWRQEGLDALEKARAARKAAEEEAKVQAVVAENQRKSKAKAAGILKKLHNGEKLTSAEMSEAGLFVGAAA
jgi:hypothetical protein